MAYFLDYFRLNEKMVCRSRKVNNKVVGSDTCFILIGVSVFHR